MHTVWDTLLNNKFFMNTGSYYNVLMASFTSCILKSSPIQLITPRSKLLLVYPYITTDLDSDTEFYW